MVKIYTRTGDHGKTGLIGGGRVEKDGLRIEAFGTVDELNAWLGLAVASLGGMTSLGTTPEGLAEVARMRDCLVGVQRELFRVGADLATPCSLDGSEDRAQRVGEAAVRELERRIDECSARLPRLTRFVLPGGCELAARLHLARTVARRAERAVVRLGRAEPINVELVRYLNRLSDLLFVLARQANALAGAGDVEV